MSANDSKRYYWLKLKKDFFQQHQIKILKSLPNGRLYALIYLELLAESTSHNGELRYSQTLPYDTITLASVIDEDKDNLEKAIETFQRLELVEILEDSTIYMREIERLVGSETGQTIRKREAKLLHGKNYPKITLESRDKSIENRDKNINNIPKHKYGEYQNVLLSDDQLDKLKRDFPYDWEDRIEKVSVYCQSTGKTYKDYLATIKNWAKMEKERNPQKKDIIPDFSHIPDPVFDEEEYNRLRGITK